MLLKQVWLSREQQCQEHTELISHSTRKRFGLKTWQEHSSTKNLLNLVQDQEMVSPSTL